MNFEKLHKTIYIRKSVRKFKNQSLTEDTLPAIKSNFKKLTPLNSSIKTEIRIVSNDEVKGLFFVKAPHYLLFFSEKKTGYLANTGFLLQQMDLYFSSTGYGSCWLGLTKPKKDFSENSNFEFVITLAFGNPNEELHRKSISEFNRKTINENCEGDNHQDIIEAARLAPSATNSQPWFFITEQSSIHCYCIKPGLLKKLLYKKMNRIDMGIALCHLWLAARHKVYSVNFYIDDKAKQNKPEGYYYFRSLRLK